jgi:ribosomal protein L11 methyltransferase
LAAEALDRWLVVTVGGVEGEWRALAAEALLACGADAVEETGHGVRTYLRPGAVDEPDSTLAEVRRALDANGAGEASLEWEWRPAEDWLAIWRRGLKPRRVGDRLIVAPSWSTPDSVDGVIPVIIDPQMAFGTGEHASTRGVLRLLQRQIRPGDVVLDVGTGSAILAIAAALLGAASAHGVENDADALINARENVTTNGVADRVTLEEVIVDTAWLESRAAAFDLILANVLSGVLRPLLPAFRTALRPAGGLILAGILQSEADGMLSAAADAGLEFIAEDREDEWWSALFRRPPR